MRFTKAQLSKIVDEKTAESASLLREASNEIFTQEGKIASLKKQLASTRLWCTVYILFASAVVFLQQMEILRPGFVREILLCSKLPFFTP